MLFREYDFLNQNVKNRFVVAPMTRVSAEEDGQPNDTMKDYYTRFAKGGFGTIVTEGIYPDQSFSQGYSHQPGLATDIHADGWKPIVEAVHEEGTAIIAQLMHAGAQMQANRYSDESIAPSAVQPKGDQLSFYGGSGPFPVPRAMDEHDFREVKESFVHSALRAKEAGFDGVELHGANGYLLDQFLTDYFNLRNDEYGGSAENRVKFVLEVIEEVRAAVGEDYPVGIRISQAKAADGEHKWAGGEEEARTIFEALGNAPLDYVHTTDPDAAASSFGEDTKTLAEAAKLFSGLPVIANGKLTDPVKAAQLLKEGQADLIAIGTGALANPDLPNLIDKGEDLREFDFKEIMLPQANIKDHELNQNIFNG
ncbi:oxidoreductase [Salimicrobium humidisoli]|uniref:NADH:flavin oxidoreductase n=1 Tax=Salimicrobium humidisoli TaxID=2029857 RepID=A0ABX4HUS9_9BACI|nr:NADH:flavin oxidoreductase [Salimicrobium humidisoli]PBB06996.1 NADH:flavin oxidoreductase [Salimicrobium humidisoli]